MKIHLHLIEDCSECHGTGKTFYDHNADTQLEPCTTCLGIGQVPTEEGQELVEFLTLMQERQARMQKGGTPDLHVVPQPPLPRPYGP